MSALGKKVRLNRIFSHPSGRIMSVAVDHFINYPIGMPESFKKMGSVISKVVEGAPSAITMNKGIAMNFMPQYAGKVPVIIQQLGVREKDTFLFASTTCEEVISLGGDAIAVAISINHVAQTQQLKHLADVVRESERYGLPVVAHIYPLGAEGESGKVSHLADDVFYAVRVGIELGVDVIKVPFTGDVASFKDIVSSSPAPVVAAGGPKCNTLDEAVKMIKDIAKSGAAGATVGRNAWGFSDVPAAINAMKKAMFEN